MLKQRGLHRLTELVRLHRPGIPGPPRGGAAEKLRTGLASLDELEGIIKTVRRVVYRR